jgi:hypothetical protein
VTGIPVFWPRIAQSDDECDARHPGRRIGGSRPGV